MRSLVARTTEAWRDAWRAPGSARNVRAARALLAAQALWILLSRPELPRLVSWPAVFLPAGARLELLRFGILRGSEGVEWVLYGVLCLVLVLAMTGTAPRASCLSAGLLLYHFAPFEEIVVGMPHTHFGGLTVSALGLLVLGFAEAPPRGREAVSAEYRWPLTLIQLLFASTYFFAFLAKLRFSGPLWFTGPNIRGYLLSAQATARPLLALEVAAIPWLCWTMAIATLLLESLFPLAVFSRGVRRVLVPTAALFHLGTVLTLNIIFPSAALLLLFVDWDSLGAWARRRAGTAAGREPGGRHAASR